MKRFREMLSKLKQTKLNKEKELSFDDLLKLLVILAPYSLLYKDIKKQYELQGSSAGFFIVSKTLLENMDKDDLYSIIILLFNTKKPDEMKVPDIIRRLPDIIRKNNLIEAYIILRNLGITE